MLSLQMNTVNLDDWIAQIRSHDHMTYEHAFWGERPNGPEVISRLVAEMQNSADADTRGKFIELLGEMGDASVIAVLMQELFHNEIGIRQWTVWTLEELGFPEGLSAAKTCRETYPDEF
jgi:HEAT repeat protein